MTIQLDQNNKKEKRIQAKKEKTINSLLLKKIDPLTINQNKTFKAYKNKKNLCLHGVAGTGKSYISIYLGMEELLHDPENNPFKSLVIIRSVVPTREMGFLPGSAAEKSAEYEVPYQEIYAELFNNPDAYRQLKARDLIKFKTTSFIRGITLKNSIIIVDEIQNMDYDELASVITRTGENCRLIFSGDFRQSDFRGRDKINREGVHKFMEIIKMLTENFIFIEFGIDDIVRSGTVKDFIIAENNYTGI